MNKAIERIKREASKQLPPKKVKFNGADVDGDEKRTRDMLNELGGKFEVTSKKNKYERWDLIGDDQHNQLTRVEVKSRPKPNDYKTWIVDSYKVDYMMDEFPFDNNYFVNVCEGKHHLYDMRYIQLCPTVKSMAKMWNGGTELKTFYQFEKQMYIIELTTGELGLGSKDNQCFGTIKTENNEI